MRPQKLPNHHALADCGRFKCRRSGIQIGTIDALIGQLCLHHELTLLTTDKDFHNVATLKPLSVWKSAMR